MLRLIERLLVQLVQLLKWELDTCLQLELLQGQQWRHLLRLQEGVRR